EKRVFLVILFTSFSGSLVSRIPGAVHFFINGEGAGQKAGSLSLNNSMISVHAKSDLPAHIIT
ncbi:hypothetical protein, partial [Escherichia coli]|uniref:hypothetical protein n=1 Tax=Escherichia coli TaxID=562 RepID=UPI00339200A4